MKNLISEDVKVWIDKSVLAELTASHSYKHLGNYSQRNGLFGAQKYFLAESVDELAHYQMWVDFVNDMGSVVDMPAISAIEFKPTTTGECIDFALTMEFDLGEHYKAFYTYIEETDPVIAQFILQFLQIQRKAVGEYGDLQTRYAIAERTGEILLFDDYLGEQ